MGNLRDNLPFRPYRQPAAALGNLCPGQSRRHGPTPLPTMPSHPPGSLQNHAFKTQF